MYIKTQFNILTFEDNDMFTGFTCYAFLTNEPKGWLLCDGREISRSRYSELFKVIGTTFGDGDGSTTFNLPDGKAKFLQGKATDENLGAYKNVGLPNITGEITIRAGKSSNSTSNFDIFTSIENQKPSGALLYKDTKDYSNNHSNISLTASGPSAGQPLVFDASKSNPIYGNSTTVQPPAITANLFIKY